MVLPVKVPDMDFTAGAVVFVAGFFVAFGVAFRVALLVALVVFFTVAFFVGVVEAAVVFVEVVGAAEFKSPPEPLPNCGGVIANTPPRPATDPVTINIVLLSIYSPKIVMITNQLLPMLTLRIAANHMMYRKRHLLLGYQQIVLAKFLVPTTVRLVVKFDWFGIDLVAFAKALLP